MNLLKKLRKFGDLFIDFSILLVGPLILILIFYFGKLSDWNGIREVISGRYISNLEIVIIGIVLTFGLLIRLLRKGK